jgi:hypothetical protein
LSGCACRVRRPSCGPGDVVEVEPEPRPGTSAGVEGGPSVRSGGPAGARVGVGCTACIGLRTHQRIGKADDPSPERIRARRRQLLLQPASRVHTVWRGHRRVPLSRILGRFSLRITRSSPIPTPRRSPPDRPSCTTSMDSTSSVSSRCRRCPVGTVGIPGAGDRTSQGRVEEAADQVDRVGEGHWFAGGGGDGLREACAP